MTRSLPRLLVLIGSGETAAQMTRVHRLIIRRLAGPNRSAADVSAVVVDTPFGFQENADTLSAELIDYFGRRLGMHTVLATFRRSDADILDRETAFARIRSADFVFSGPGSPSYALRHWRDSAVASLFTERLKSGGALVLASAAALTAGRLSVPIYEIYKAGEDPHWLPGLDILGAAGISAAVIPHFDNAEGGHHDTRFCFLGERRLRSLQEQMPDDVAILGLDEHTALMLDLDADRGAVRGRGRVTYLLAGEERVYEPGAEFPVAALRGNGLHETQPADRGVAARREPETTSLARQTVALRAQVATLSEQAAKLEDLVVKLIELRRGARDRGDYVMADWIREGLATIGVELQDRSDGTTEYRVS